MNIKCPLCNKELSKSKFDDDFYYCKVDRYPYFGVRRIDQIDNTKCRVRIENNIIVWFRIIYEVNNAEYMLVFEDHGLARPPNLDLYIEGKKIFEERFHIDFPKNFDELITLTNKLLNFSIL